MKNSRSPYLTLLFGFGLILGVAFAFSAPFFAAPKPAAKPGAFKPQQPAKAGQQTATLAAGCFWAVESMFKQMKGVVSAVPGYAGGKTKNPTYEQVCTGTTGHTETVNIVFDPKVVTYSDLLRVILTITDPTTLNRQGPDEGTQYRSAIFYRNAAQKKDAEAMIRKINAEKIWPNKIVTEVTPFTKFYEAEPYHHDYFMLHPDEPYTSQVVAPKVEHFRREFKGKLKG